MEYTVTSMAGILGIPRYRAYYLLKREGIKPVGRAGKIDMYGPEALTRLRSIERPEEFPRREAAERALERVKVETAYSISCAVQRRLTAMEKRLRAVERVMTPAQVEPKGELQVGNLNLTTVEAEGEPAIRLSISDFTALLSPREAEVLGVAVLASAANDTGKPVVLVTDDSDPSAHRLRDLGISVARRGEKVLLQFGSEEPRTIGFDLTTAKQIGRSLLSRAAGAVQARVEAN